MAYSASNLGFYDSREILDNSIGNIFHPFGEETRRVGEYRTIGNISSLTDPASESNLNHINHAYATENGEYGTYYLPRKFDVFGFPSALTPSRVNEPERPIINTTTLNEKKLSQDLRYDNSFTVYAKLKQDENFQIFTNLIEKAGFQDYCSNPLEKFTMFIFPDKLLSQEVKDSFLSLGRAESRNIISFSIHPAAKMWGDLSTERYLLPTLHPFQQLYLNGPQGIVGISNISFQTAKVLGFDNYFRNGVCHVIDRPLIPLMMR